MGHLNSDGFYGGAARLQQQAFNLMLRGLRLRGKWVHEFVQPPRSAAGFWLKGSPGTEFDLV